MVERLWKFMNLSLLRYGHEIARLNLALAAVKQGYDVARKGSVAQSVQRDVKASLVFHTSDDIPEY